jgi:predicted ABC-type ATPase
MSSADAVPWIYVLAGTNGAGKSSIGGAALIQNRAEYFNPDSETRRIQSANPGIGPDEANSAAWMEGKRLLERAMAERCSFAFETTLGGKTISRLLEDAVSRGIEVRVWYAGLSSPELHIARVRSRVQKGGHDVPEAKIRERYDSGRLNLIRLLPKLTALKLYDNSEEADPDAGVAPKPKLLLHMERGRVISSCDLSLTPDWAKPILAAAFQA